MSSKKYKLKRMKFDDWFLGYGNQVVRDYHDAQVSRALNAEIILFRCVAMTSVIVVVII